MSAIRELGERQRVRLFMRTDRYERFVSCLVFLPRDRFNTANRLKIGEILRAALGAETVDWELRLTEWVLVRIHFTLRVPAGELPDYDAAALEAQIVEATRSWDDDLQAALVEEMGEEAGTVLFRRYGSAFPAAYRADLARALGGRRRAAAGGARGRRRARPQPLPPARSAARSVALQALPARRARLAVGRAADVREPRPHGLRRAPVPGHAARCAAGLDLRLRPAGRRRRRLRRDPRALPRGLRARLARRGGTRRLQRPDHRRRAGLARGHDAALARALPAPGRDPVQRPLHGGDAARATPTSPPRSWRCSTPASTRPATARGAEACVAEIEAAIDAVDSLDEDRILRGFLSVLRAMLRTNYYLPGPKPYVSFKLDPTRIPLVPLPKPRFEIFVHSPRVEGVHLRGGSVARGGLRWSDRREDFRTEILGLMKAQMVKNALIVPVGAKGGFVVKRAGDEVVACYTTFISALLDITDTISGGKVVPPEHVVRHDGDDPYLVVAADKGTATFSDIANGVAQEYGFWLGDAFASGGSVGYDHKAMGITARSAWVSVQRHFRELGDRRPGRGLHGRRRRRHERRRVRQRHAALAAHPAGGGVRPPARVPGSGSRPGALDRGAPAAVRRRPVLVGGLRHVADLRGRRRLPAHREVDPAERAGAGRARDRGRPADAERADPGDPARARRPAVERRDRDLRQGPRGDARGRRRQGQRRRARERERAAREGRRRGRQPRLHPARADRVRAQRRAREHRRDRQRRRRQLLRPRGQHQGPAGHGRGRRRHDRQAAQRACWRR